MNASIRRSPSRADVSVRSLARGLGRGAIWTVIALLLVRGVLAGHSGESSVSPRDAAVGVDPPSAAFAVRYARAYLADPSPTALAPFLAEGARMGAGRPPGDGGALVAQAEVTEVEELGDGRAILTVACELRDARTLFLAVPIARASRGEVAALGAPSIVAAPGPAGADPERPQPRAGPAGSAIQALVEKFLPAYIGSSEAADLAYFLTAGVEVQPLGGALGLAAVTEVEQLGSGEGARREVLVAARLSDPATGAAYPVVYRLGLVRRDRWYVEAVEGALS